MHKIFVMRTKLVILALCLVSILVARLLYPCSDLCSSDWGCEDKISETIASSDGSYLAGYVQRDCGATTRISPMIKLQKKSVFFATCQTEIVAVGNDIYGLRWEGKTLVVLTSNSSNLYERTNHVFGIDIDYKIF